MNKRQISVRLIVTRVRWAAKGWRSKQTAFRFWETLADSEKALFGSANSFWAYTKRILSDAKWRGAILKDSNGNRLVVISGGFK